MKPCIKKRKPDILLGLEHIALIELSFNTIAITGIFRRPASVRSDPIISRQQFLVYAFERITSSRLAVDKFEYNLEFWVASRQG